MESRKWEDLDQDCLVKIFEKVETKDLISGVPFVCKSWYKTAQIPDCWRCLDLQILPNQISDEESITEYIKFAVDRSSGAATKILLPNDSFKSEALDYISDRCPALTCINIPYRVGYEHDFHIPELIYKWKNLEVLHLGYAFLMFQKIVSEINIHCKKFVGLYVVGNFRYEDISTIVTLLPNIRLLVLKKSTLDREHLKLILSGCTELVHLDVRDCIGFNEDDDEILRMASYIKYFDSKGADVLDEEILQQLFLDLQQFDVTDDEILRIASDIKYFDPNGAHVLDGESSAFSAFATD